MPPPPATPWASCIALLLPAAAPTFAQYPSSWPQVYPGMPTGDYSPEWQNYFQVTENLPNVSWPLARSWAGNIPVQRAGHPNNTLFFWAFESSNGPGASSLLGLLFENGPIRILSNYSLSENGYAWSTVADYVWIDQPVGTGYSTVDANGYVANEDQVAADFMGSLENFVKVFPSFATRPLHIAGESYAGTYIPYITKAYFGMDNPPVNLSGIAIGNGAITSLETFMELPVMSVLETYPQIIGYDTEAFEYFRKQNALCGYNLTLQYPQPGYFPSLNAPIPSSYSAVSSAKYNGKMTKTQFMREAQGRFIMRLGSRDGSPLDHGERLRARDIWKRDLTGRTNGSIDPWYQCDLHAELLDYAINFTFPWWTFSLPSNSVRFYFSFSALDDNFDIYNIPDALGPEAAMDASVLLDNAQTRAAIHAPTSKDWGAPYSVFGPTNDTVNQSGDPSVEPMAFLTDLATNATAHNISVVIFSGNDDALIPHFGSQIAIQNTTFGGIQGFTRKPDTPWYNDAGELAGIVHQERGWKYTLVEHAGHLVGYTNPISALTLMREFIFGNNRTGLVTTSSDGAVSVVRGEASLLEGEIITGQAGIYYGQATTASTYFFPSATVNAWDAYIATATATAGQTNAGSRSSARWMSGNSGMSARLTWMGGALAIMLF